MISMMTLCALLQAFFPYFCHAENVVTKMFPENGATDVNIDTHLMLTIDQRGEGNLPVASCRLCS